MDRITGKVEFKRGTFRSSNSNEDVAGRVLAAGKDNDGRDVRLTLTDENLIFHIGSDASSSDVYLNLGELTQEAVKAANTISHVDDLFKKYSGDLPSESLDDIVHDVLSRHASSANNGGMEEQLCALVSFYGRAETERLLAEAIDEEDAVG